MVVTSGVICPVMGLRRAARSLVSMASMICWMKVRLSSRVSKYSFFKTMCVFCAFDLGGREGHVWDKDARIWWPSECISRIDAKILCGCEDNSYVSMVSASQGGWN